MYSRPSQVHLGDDCWGRTWLQKNHIYNATDCLQGVSFAVLFIYARSLAAASQCAYGVLLVLPIPYLLLALSVCSHFSCASIKEHMYIQYLCCAHVCAGSGSRQEYTSPPSAAAPNIRGCHPDPRSQPCTWHSLLAAVEKVIGCREREEIEAKLNTLSPFPAFDDDCQKVVSVYKPQPNG